MNEQQIKDKIIQSIQNLASGDAGENVEALFQTLGYSTERKVDLDRNDPKDFLDIFGCDGINRQRALFSEWKSVDFVFQLTEKEIKSSGQLTLFKNQVDRNYLQSYIFLTVGLRGNNYTRTQLSDITREINRQSDPPIMVLFRHGECFTLSVINRRPNKRETSKDVLEKITLIKDIFIANPHRAHIEILFDLSLPQLYKQHQFTNFDQLHDAWQKTLDTSELNNKFFQELANWYFWAVEYVKFPDGAEKDERVRNAVSVIRLLTRLIFVWFLIEKGLIDGSLFNDKVLSNLLRNLEHNESTFYRAILQNLFFATLNQEMNTPEKPDNRKFRNKAKQKGQRNQNYLITNLYRYEDYFVDSKTALELFQTIPFLNGGLFECLDKRVEEQGKEIDIRIDGFSDNPKFAAVVPNFLFFSDEQDIDLNEVYGTKNKKYKVRGLIHIFNRYKFTITENTPLEQEIALDPELLGKVFENLLASYNEETKTTARKKTGSFYTPREIVDYMVDESLIIYLETKLTTEQDSGEKRQNFSQSLQHLFSYTVSDTEKLQFSEDEVIKLIAAIDALNILDPACGSGAFPMGILHKLVFILSKLDPNNKRWKQQQKEREIKPVLQDIQTAKKISYEAAREQAIAQLQERLNQIEEDFEKNEMDYPRKLFLVENCIYGVDIQPIAVQITKLRFFISLIVDQKIDNNQPNRGILPLPNLETKFVAANALLPIKLQLNLRSQEIIDKEAELAEVRKKHFTARTQKTKQKYRERDKELRQEICKLLKNIGLQDATAETLAQWNPYDQNTSANFFDPEWMFGLNDGFDIVLGNPPYVRQEQIKELKSTFKQHYDCYTGTADLYVYFYELGYQLLKSQGVLSYISSNKYFRAGYGEKLRSFLGKNTRVHQLIDFGDTPVFTAIAYPSIIIFSKEPPNPAAKTRAISWQENQPLEEFPQIFDSQSFLISQSELKPDGWRLESTTVLDLLQKLRKVGTPLGEYVNGRFYRGILTGFNEAFVVDRATRDRLIAEHSSSAEVLKPFLRGRDVKRWKVEYQDLWLIFTRRGIDIKRYPAIENYLSQYKEQLTPGTGRKAGTYKWYEIQDNIAYWQEFEQPKILYPDIAIRCEFAFDNNAFYSDCTLFLIPANSPYLLGFLNSGIVQFFINQICPAVRGNFRRFKSIYVSQTPIPTTTESDRSVIETLVNYIIYLTSQLKDIPSHGEKMVETTDDKLMLSYFEQIVDALVMELYLPEELHSHDKYFVRHLLSENIPALESIKSDKMQALRQIFKRLFNSEHPIRANIYFLNSLEVVRIIRGLA